MKKLAIAVVAGVAVAALVVTLMTRDAKQVASTRDWPLGLGDMESVPQRYPARQANAAANELTRLAKEIDIDFTQRRQPQRGADDVAEYVRAQLQKAEAAIDPAPQIPAELAAVRAHLLASREIVWEQQIAKGTGAPMPNMLAHMRLMRLLVASALERARMGDAAAWEDLRAARTLSQGLWQRPEIISAVIALTIDRYLVVAARKMPRPAPAWFDELRTFDHRRAMLAAMQGDAWLIGKAIDDDAESNDDGWFQSTVSRPYLVLARADFLTHQRRMAGDLARVTTCELDAQRFGEQSMQSLAWWNAVGRMATPNFAAVWQRLFRFRAELELTEHVLGLRSGSRSNCSDGQWVIAPDRVAFSKAIAIAGPPGTTYPLEFRR